MENKLSESTKIPKASFKIEFVSKKPMTEQTIIKEAKNALEFGKIYKTVKRLKIENEHGLHARAATALIQKIMTLKSNFIIEKDGKEVNSKSIMDIMMNSMGKGTIIKLKAKGTDPEVVERELAELMKIKDDGQKVFEEQKIFVDLSQAININEKMDLLKKKISQERSIFLETIARYAEIQSSTHKLSENEFNKIAIEFCKLANLKGIRNDIFKISKIVPFNPETSVEVYVKESGTMFHIISKEGIIRTIQTQNLSDEILSQCNHKQISRPIDEFNEEIVKLLNGSHAYEIKRLNNKLALYYYSLDKFLEAHLDQFYISLDKVLKKRMEYEHHKFLGVKYLRV